jgi:hypothetical protein
MGLLPYALGAAVPVLPGLFAWASSVRVRSVAEGHARACALGVGSGCWGSLTLPERESRRALETHGCFSSCVYASL